MDTVQPQIEKVWKTEQEILDAIHQICTEHGLRYSLAYGTLIGAIRHGGFIPWDDDIDLVMPREDYEKLLAIWNDVAPKDYILQNKRTNSDFTQNFTKIRKDHTTFLQDDADREKKYHKGIFVDIFPGDRVPAGKFARMMQYVFSAINLLYARGFSSGSGGMMGAVERVLLKVPVKYHAKLSRLAENMIRKWNGNDDLMYVFPSTIGWAKHYYTADLFSNMKTIQYCGKAYSCVSDPDAFLRQDYGDYMQLPPKEERVWKHHPILIDFEHNYEELNLQR